MKYLIYILVLVGGFYSLQAQNKPSSIPVQTLNVAPNCPSGLNNGQVCDEIEFQALKAFYESTNGANWTNNTGWSTGINNTDHSFNNFKNWYGVTVSNGDVVALELFGKGLSGTIPPELGNLSSLKTLGLSQNYFTGGIPKELSRLTYLENLLLDYTGLTGEIPSEFGSLTSIQRIQITYTLISGEIPKELGNLSNLKFVLLNNNQLTGNIPKELSNLTQMESLSLGNNNLTGAIPKELGNLTQLKDIYLNNNSLTGSIPKEWGSLSQLLIISLKNNLFDDFTNWISLTNLSSSLGLEIYDNRFDFGDLELFFQSPGISKLISFSPYDYSPQAKIPVIQNYSFNSGDYAEIPLITGGTANVYQWFKKTSAGDVAVSGATQAILSLPAITTTDAGVYYCAVTNTIVPGLTLYTEDITITVAPPVPVCDVYDLQVGGNFMVSQSGALLYNLCGRVAMAYGCFMGASATINQVVATSAIKLKHDWTPTGYTGSNPYEDGYKGKWRSEKTYAYKTALNSSPTEKNYNAGTFSLSLFNWQGGNGSNWINASTVLSYNSNGEPLEERDVLGNYSAAKFGYNGALAYLVAQNATNNAVLFESFENLYGNTFFEDMIPYTSSQVTFTNQVAHSGKNAIIVNDGNVFSTRTFTFSADMQKSGLWVKCWMRLGTLTSFASSSNEINLKVKLAATTNNTPNLNQILITKKFKTIAQTGEWVLCEALLESSDFNAIALGTAFTPVLSNETGNQIYLDDVRIQPAYSQMIAYVYDKDFRLITSFDDQHFGLYYQYNPEGKLVRKIVETERGMKTIQETQYNIPKVPRN